MIEFIFYSVIIVISLFIAFIYTKEKLNEKNKIPFSIKN